MTAYLHLMLLSTVFSLWEECVSGSKLLDNRELLNVGRYVRTWGAFSAAESGHGYIPAARSHIATQPFESARQQESRSISRGALPPSKQRETTYLSRSLTLTRSLIFTAGILGRQYGVQTPSDGCTPDLVGQPTTLAQWNKQLSKPVFG
jgi:hypothetical protein